MKLNSMREFYVHELRDLYNAEQQVRAILPRLAKAASSSRLAELLNRYADMSRTQLARLERICDALGVRAAGVVCQGMRGLVEEGKVFWRADGETAVHDAALIAAAQRIKHYELAAYGCSRTLAQLLGEEEASDLLQQGLDEESEADKMLTRLARESIFAGVAAG